MSERTIDFSQDIVIRSTLYVYQISALYLDKFHHKILQKTLKKKKKIENSSVDISHHLNKSKNSFRMFTTRFFTASFY